MGLVAIIPARYEDVTIHFTKGENRKMMKRHLPEEYKRRSTVETVHSVIKKRIICKIKNSGQFEKEIVLKMIG